uniref:Sushi domain-containing protein n=1 Tax=Plectus sambesii TaxID=2011161 RepID=A0A914X2K1_9BILA
MEGDTVTMTCDASARLDGTVVTATCSPAGVLSPTSPCLPCPDTTWIYDPTTDRCFKAFAETPVPGACSIYTPCVGLAAQYGVPSTMAYTMNFQLLIDAAQIGIDNNVGSRGFYHVGIGDPVANELYQLDDGTPVPLASILPFFIPGYPSDGPGNVDPVLIAGIFGTVGFVDAYCTIMGTDGSICQLQLTP